MIVSELKQQIRQISGRWPKTILHYYIPAVIFEKWFRIWGVNKFPLEKLLFHRNSQERVVSKDPFPSTILNYSKYTTETELQKNDNEMIVPMMIKKNEERTTSTCSITGKCNASIWKCKSPILTRKAHGSRVIHAWYQP